MNYIGGRLDGRYRIDELIGEGGMANVYRGVDLANGNVIAIKILKEECCANEELVRRFANESRAISVLNHPCIVKVFDVNVTDKVHYIVMEYIEGITLKEYIEQRGEPLTYKEVVHFMSQILRALQHAHDKGIIHRDIKPQNIMILEDGSIKMMDFGIARMARSEIHTPEDQAIGSVHYISPEQAQGAETDLRADIYSVGIMMYEMLSGKLPFEDESVVAVAVKQISDEAVPLHEVNPSVPEGLCDITMKAMAKEQGMRYQSALEMLRDIEEFKQNPSIKFEYEYLAENSPKRYINKVMSESGRVSAKSGRTASAQKAKKQKKIKRRRIGFLVPVVLGITLAIVGVCVLYSYNLLQNSDNPFFSNQEEIALPDFTGMQYNDVVAMLRTAPYNHLRLQEPNLVYNPAYKPGEVITQSPQSDNDDPKSVKANQRLVLTVCEGYTEVEVPNVLGMSRREAVMAILEAGLMPYAKAERVNDEGQTGVALRSEPEAGTLVYNSPGTIVTIYVGTSFGQWERSVPDITGMTLLEAQERLDAIGLQIGLHEEEAMAGVEPGRIFEQSPRPGTGVTVGTDVHVKVAAAAPPPSDEPTDVSSSSTSASASTSGSGSGSGASASHSQAASSSSSAPASSSSADASSSASAPQSAGGEGGTTPPASTASVVAATP